MGKVVSLVTIREKDRNNLITTTPWEFRWSDGGSHFFSQVPKGHAAFFKTKGVPCGCKDLTPLAGGRHLKGGLACTIQALFLQRHNEEKMRQIYYLTGLVDCMINRRHPLLRTHHIRGFYGKIMTLKSILCLNWYGSIDQVLLPGREVDRLIHDYPAALSRAETMKELYRIIREATDEMFDILSQDYVFYAPSR
jgi:hypothetical protein